MEAYAVVETGGKQYLVQAKKTLRVDRLEADVGSQVSNHPVLAVSDGTKLRVGTPALGDAKVVCTVVKHVRGEKVVSFKKKRRKGYSRKIGHRSELTVLTVDSIQ
jgi:large subunit ribosomal protein L21